MPFAPSSLEEGLGATGPSVGSSSRRAGALPDLLALLVAATLVCSPLAFGYFDFTTWAPLGLVTFVLLVLRAFLPGAALSSHGRGAMAGIGLLLVLSFASILWAESRDAAWTSANQLAVYAAVLAIGLGIRGRATAWALIVLLGLPALATSLVLAGHFLTGGGADAFVQSRLSSPIGYVNGTAALLMMGVWPWLGLAERSSSRPWRAAAIGVAALIAATATLTQTRAILLVAAATIVLVLLAAPGRTGRAVNLLIVIASVAAGAHWTLRAYSSTGPVHAGTPESSVLRAAAVALLGAAALSFALKWLTQALWTRLPQRHRAGVGRGIGRALLAASAVALIATALAAHGRIQTQWHDFTTLGDPASENRYLELGGGSRHDLWRIALDEFVSEPLGGVGAGNYADQEYLRRRELEHVSTPHSLELQTLAELGTGGAVGLALLLAAILAAGLRPGEATLAAADPGLRVAALGVFSAWLAGTSVDWVYDIPGLTGMAMLAAAVLLLPAQSLGAGPSRRVRAAARGRRSHAPLALVLMALALPAASLARQYASALFADAGRALVAKDPVRALGKLRSAEQLDPWSLSTQYAVAAAYARLDDYAGARAALLAAERLEPENYVPPALLGDIAARAGHARVALADYRRALALDPLEPALRRAVKVAARAVQRRDQPTGRAG